MKKWYREVGSLLRTEIQEAVNNDKWQEFRLSLKGLSTEQKLDRLENYCQQREQNGRGLARVEVVRVTNYITALLRGGQLKRVGNEIVVNR